MKLVPFIAFRYLFAKKSQNVINIISAICAVGMAIGTAALIIILSIYNGFDSLVKSMMSSVEPDLLIQPTQGKYFTPEGESYDWLYDNPDVISMCTIIEEQVFISYGGKQSLALAKGVDEIYEEETHIRDYVRNGEFKLHRKDVPLAAVGVGLAHKLGINPYFLTAIEIYYPSRNSRLSIANPASSLNIENVWPSCTFSINSLTDLKTIIVPIETMSNLLELNDGEVSSVEIRCKNSEKLQKELQLRLGDGFLVKNRFEQNESLYKMMKYEKTIIFLILFFVIIIISFNVFGCLSMLIIEKKDDIQTLRAMGAEDRTIRKIFTLEGWLISILGMVSGLILGIAVALIQQKFGIVPMPGSFMVTAYPVIIKISDIIITCVSIMIIAYLIALIPSRSKLDSKS